MSRRIKLCIVNRNYPPEKGATGYYAHQLVRFLERTEKYDIHIVSAGPEEDNANLHYIRPRYSGRVKTLRLCSAILESYMLIKKAKGLKADFYIIMTDPAFLNYWASKKMQDEKWALWSMDIYPDAFVANNLTSSQNIGIKYFRKTIRRSPPDYLIALGSQQRNFFIENYYPNINSTIIPVGLLNEHTSISENKKENPIWHNENTITFGYIGTIGEAHAFEAVIRLVKNIDKLNYKCILSCSGAKAEMIMQEALHLKNIEIVDFIDQEHLPLIDIQIVALLRDWTHICVPSKALSALQHGSAVFFIGEGESDTWDYVESAGWRISQNCDSSDILHNLDINILRQKKLQALVLAENLKNSLNLAHQEIDKTIQKIT